MSETKFGPGKVYGSPDSIQVDEAEFGEWRPIATAPKDGTFILLHYQPPFGVISPEIAVWLPRRGVWIGTSGFVFPSDGVHAPTHWMPLPEPPK